MISEKKERVDGSSGSSKSKNDRNQEEEEVILQLAENLIWLKCRMSLVQRVIFYILYKDKTTTVFVWTAASVTEADNNAWLLLLQQLHLIPE